jgi:hypothetical protein
MSRQRAPTSVGGLSDAMRHPLFGNVAEHRGSCRWTRRDP